MRRTSILAIATALSLCSGCPQSTPSESGQDTSLDVPEDSEDAADIADPPEELLSEEGTTNLLRTANGWYRGDLHYHTNYSGDAKEQGGDDIGVALAIADAWRQPVWVDAHPEYADNGLDFIAVTDHRTTEGLQDPEFVHDHLILIPGEEYGSSGHANIFGITEHISQDPIGDETKNERQLDAIEEAHNAGGLFSVNHPIDDNNWVWDTPTIDAIEVWNGPWAGFILGSSLEELEAGIAGAGVENPFIRDALLQGTNGHNHMALRFWYNHLTAGLHIPVLGGSDRHMIVPAGLPTTYIQVAEEVAGSATWTDLLTGIQTGATIVSRSPVGAQVLLQAIAEDGESFPLGASLPSDRGPWTLDITVTRAAGGMLQLIGGPLLDPDSDGRIHAETNVLVELPISADRVHGTFEWTPDANGAWVHAIVYEAFLPEEPPEIIATLIDDLATPFAANGLVAMVEALIPLLDVPVMLNPMQCDPALWDHWKPQCMPADPFALATFYLHDNLERILHRVFEDGAPTEWAMGAITSAFLVPASAN
jgi:hypothetical protein